VGEKLKELLRQPRTWIILAVAVGAYLLYRRAAGARGGGGQVMGPPPMTGGGGGGGGGFSPQDQAAFEQRQLGLQQANLALAGIKERQEYQGKLDEISLRQAQGEVEYRQAGQKLQLQYQAGILPGLLGAAEAQYGAQAAQNKAEANYYNQLSKRQVSCPGSASVRIDPATGQAYCRTKTSGGFLGLPLGEISRSVAGTITGFLGGVQAAAPGIGYSAANAYAGRELGQLTQHKSTSPVAGRGGFPQSTGVISPGPSYSPFQLPTYPYGDQG